MRCVFKRIKLTIGFSANVNQVVAQPLCPTQQLYKLYTGPAMFLFIVPDSCQSVTYVLFKNNNL